MFSYGQNKNFVNPTVLVSFNFEQLNGGWKKYKIDKSIKDSVSKDVIVRGIGPGQYMTEFVSFDSKWHEDKERFASFVNYGSGDTTNIIITSRVDIGCRIIIVGDSCKIFTYVFDSAQLGGNGLKLNKSDTFYKTELLVPPTSYTLTLTKKPTFVAGEIIEGHVEYQSFPFYRESKLPFEKGEFSINGYFRTFDVTKLEGIKNAPTWLLH